MMRWWDNEIFVKKRSPSEENLLQLRTQLIRETDERIANESMGMRKHIFRVRAETNRLERVGVTGACQELGSWDTTQIVLLNREEETDIWSKEVLVPLLTDPSRYLYYRYVVVTDESYSDENPKRNEERNIKSVRRWEANSKYRKIEPITKTFQATSSFRKDYLNLTASEINEMRREKSSVKREPERFGTYRNNTTISKGWLTTDNVLQLKLFKGRLKLFSEKYKDRPVYVKLRLIRLSIADLGVDDFCEDPDDGWPVVELSVLKTNSSHFQRQDKFGTRLCGVENVVFQIFHDSSQTMGIVLDYYAYKASYKTLEPKVDSPLHIAFSVLHPCTMPNDEGDVTTEVCSIKGPSIGEVKLKYVFIKSPLPLKFKLSRSLPYEWSRMWKHGSIKTCTEVRENTLSSLQDATASGRFDFVEIPLQFTKDGVVVFAHSKYIVCGIKQPADYVPLEQFQVPLRNFTLHQLHRMRIMPVQQCDSILKMPGSSKFTTQDENNMPFPTLMQLLNRVDKSIGFFLDVKTMVCREDGTYDEYHKHDVNNDVDKLLKTLQQSLGKRQVVLASFHPDVCTMLKLKQNLWPVMFLFDGIPERYEGYDKDERCSSSDAAISFANSMNFQGLGINSKTLGADYNALKLRQRNLAVYTTKEPNDTEDIGNLILTQHLTGLICTREDSMGKIRRPFRYLFEPKGNERTWIRDWADEVAEDGYSKPEVHPLEIPRFELVQFYSKLPHHQIPAGIERNPKRSST